MAVHVSSSCRTGPYLDEHLVQKLPRVFGPAHVNRVLRNCVQSLVNAASDPSALHGMLRQGKGSVRISGELWPTTFVADKMLQNTIGF